MHRRSGITMFRWFSEHPFRQSTRPISSILLKPIATTSNQTLFDSISPPTSYFLNQNTSGFKSFLHPRGRNREVLRNFGSESEPSLDQNKEIDEINLKFAEAREEIETALESKETVYFDEEAECAREAVKAVLDMFDGLLAKLPESEKAAVQRSMGLKIEQLKAELDQLNE